MKEICSEFTFSLAAIFFKDSDALTLKLNPFLNVREGAVEQVASEVSMEMSTCNNIQSGQK